jgi:hypothetical protein
VGLDHGAKPEKLGMVVHFCNFSYLRSGSISLRLDQAKLARSISKQNYERAGGVA